MQDAYFQEKGDVGNWVVIGYSAPGEKGNGSSYASNVFTYTGNDCGKGTACTWTATPKTKLNDCTTAMHWQLSATASGNNGSGAYTAFTIGDPGSSSDCLALTASWSNLQGSH